MAFASESYTFPGGGALESTRGMKGGGRKCHLCRVAPEDGLQHRLRRVAGARVGVPVSHVLQSLMPHTRLPHENGIRNTVSDRCTTKRMVLPVIKPEYTYSGCTKGLGRGSAELQGCRGSETHMQG